MRPEIFASASERWGFRRLRPVREGRVILCDGQHYFNRPGPRLLETLEILAEALHPGTFQFGHECSGWERLPLFPHD